MKGLIFTYLLTYGGAIAALFNPYVGLLIYVCFAILRPADLWWYSVEPGNYARIVALGLLFGWLARGLGNWRLGKARGITLAGIGFLAWSAVASFGVQEPERSWNYVEILAKIILPVVVGITTINSPKQLWTLAWVIVLSQGYLAYEFNVLYFQGYNRLFLDGFAGLDNNGVAVALDTCIGMAFFLGLYSERWWQKGLAFVCAALMAHAVLFSYSRGGMLGLGCVGLVAFFLIPKRVGHYIAFLLAIALVIRLAGPEVRERFFTSFATEQERDDSAASRLRLWSGCWQLTLENPLTGIGTDHWPLNAPRFGFYLGKQAHTTPLRIAAEMGIPGFLCWSLFYGICIVRLWPLACGKGPPDQPWVRPLAGMVIPSLIGFLVSSLFVSLEHLEPPYYAVLIGAGVLKLLQYPNGEAALLEKGNSVG
jgi:probable O-glycosylation ligase (exosortase A-associated)